MSTPRGRDRIIPAYAGCTFDLPSGIPLMADHPRIRGVHLSPSTVSPTPPGSSPHTRGALPGEVEDAVSIRIIPAYAGCTTWGRISARARRDHPRIRGVHSTRPREVMVPRGSSPHTRGARRAARRGGRSWRIIPAYAGCTPTAPWVGPSSRDHPRIRGVHSNPSHKIKQSWGSSPHTRGALSLQLLVVCPSGIIPAYAGCTRPPPPPPVFSTDHPRIRGVHVLCDRMGVL